MKGERSSTNSRESDWVSHLFAVLLIHDWRPPESCEMQPQRRLCIGIDGNWICNKVGCDLNRLLTIAKVCEAQGIDNFIILTDSSVTTRNEPRPSALLTAKRLESTQSRQEQH